MKYKHILAIDPSGSYKEGNGTTGWALMNYKEKLIAIGTIKASDYDSQEAYWDAHIDLIRYNHKKYSMGTLIVVIEDYVLYADKARNQTNSQMETCRLLGLMQWACWKMHQNYTLQLAATVKTRWNDDLLFREHILTKCKKKIIHSASGIELKTEHTKDALRHALHYTICRNETKEKKKYQPIKGAYGNVRSNYQNGRRKTQVNTRTYRNY
jgi:hypothetical protein